MKILKISIKVSYLLMKCPLDVDLYLNLASLLEELIKRLL